MGVRRVCDSPCVLALDIYVMGGLCKLKTMEFGFPFYPLLDLCVMPCVIIVPNIPDRYWSKVRQNGLHEIDYKLL